MRIISYYLENSGVENNIRNDVNRLCSDKHNLFAKVYCCIFMGYLKWNSVLKLYE